MKPVFQILLVVVLSVLAVSAVAAETSSPFGGAVNAEAAAKVGDGEVFLAVARPDVADLALPGSLTRARATQMAAELIEQEAAPLLAHLEQRQARGEIQGFDIRPDLGGILVTMDEEGRTDMRTAPGVLAVATSGQQIPSCASASVAALAEELLARNSRPTPDSAAITNPSIQLRVPPSTTGWSSVSGQTLPRIAVSVRILRAGREVAQLSTTSTSDGYYDLYPAWNLCPSTGYNWWLESDDVVEVTANGNTVSTVAVALYELGVNPSSNVISGRTKPNRPISITVTQPLPVSCGSDSQTLAGRSDRTGYFAIDSSVSLDFHRNAQAVVRVGDEQGNFSYNSAYAYQVYCSSNGSYCYGVLPANVNYQAVHLRNGQDLSTVYGRTSDSGSIYFYFPRRLEAYDVVRLTGGGHLINYSFSGWSGALDPTTDRLIGETAGGRSVRVSFRRDLSSWSPNCASSYSCAGGKAGADGHVTITSPGDVLRGDYAYVEIYDEEGNYEFSDRHPAPVIVANTSFNNITGIWRRLYVGLSVTVLNQFNSPLVFVSGIQASSYDGRFYAYPNVTLEPGYKIRVSEGDATEEMLVSSLTARTQNDRQRVEGAGQAGYLRTYWYDFNSTSRAYTSVCREQNHSGGAFVVSQMPTAGQDFGYVKLRGQDGHYTERYASAFSVNISRDGDYLWGYTETPLASVNVLHQRGNSVLGSWSFASYSSGYFYFRPENGMGFRDGDSLSVVTGDGDSLELTVPPLSVAANPPTNEIVGLGPAGESVFAETRRVYGTPQTGYSYYSQSKQVPVSATNRYRASFANLYWSRDNRCYAVDVGHRCAQPAVYYYAPGDHAITLNGTFPAVIAADAYENDNEVGAAKPAELLQHRTLHSMQDVDWVRIEVSALDAAYGVPYRMQTQELGWGTDTILQLYAADGTTLLASNDDYTIGRASRITWTPQAPGVYYLKVLPWPYSSYSAGHCDASYDLLILPMRGTATLPLIRR